MAWVKSWPIGYEDCQALLRQMWITYWRLWHERGDLQRNRMAFSFHPQNQGLHELFNKKRNRQNLVIPMIPLSSYDADRPINKSEVFAFSGAQCDEACQAYADFSAGNLPFARQ